MIIVVVAACPTDNNIAIENRDGNTSDVDVTATSDRHNAHVHIKDVDKVPISGKIPGFQAKDDSGMQVTDMIKKVSYDTGIAPAADSDAR